jgi:alkylated DNA repair dioxygenase AlkB
VQLVTSESRVALSPLFERAQSTHLISFFPGRNQSGKNIKMDGFLFPRKRRRLTAPPSWAYLSEERPRRSSVDDDDDSTDTKLAMLLSLFPHTEEAELLDTLVSCDGSVKAASTRLSKRNDLLPSLLSSSPRATKKLISITGSTAGIQTSLSSYVIPEPDAATRKPGMITETAVFDAKRPLTKKGKTLCLFTPEDIAEQTPCSIIHNFLPPEQANALLIDLLEEARTFERYTFKIFNKTVRSPHTGAFFVANPEDERKQTSEYVYNGTFRTDVRQHTAQMRAVSEKVQCAINAEIEKRIRTRYPEKKKLKYQSPKEWIPNVAVVNCYDGPAESVGYHSDELTYLGPRAVIGSLSLGVAREFRVRKIVARVDEERVEAKNEKAGGDEYHDRAPTAASASSRSKKDTSSIARADAQGQISIHLPHNSLLVMHAEMQEEWKHSIPAVQAISPHPISGNRRINITYRWYKESLHPSYTPQCRCGIPTVLRCVQRKQDTRGKYMWMCYAGSSPEKEGCPFFEWAEFDDDGDPIWKTKQNELRE